MPNNSGYVYADWPRIENDSRSDFSNADLERRANVSNNTVIRRAASKKLPETDVGLFKQFAQTFIWKSVFLEQFSWMIQRRYQIRC